MQIYSLLGDEEYRRVRDSVPSSISIEQIGAHQLERELRSGHARALILDPCALRADAFTSILAATVEGGGALLLYIPAQGQTGIERTVEAARRLAIETVTAGVDDMPAVIRARIVDMMQPSVPALILHGIADRLDGLRPVMQRLVVNLYGWSALPRSVSALSTMVRVQIRTMNRWLEEARLGSASVLLTGAHLARAWVPLGNKHYTLVDVVRDSGFPSVKALTDAFPRVFGMSARQARRSLHEREFANPIIASLRR